MELATLIELAEEKAKRDHDGHLTLLRFTTHWKCMGGTPELTGGEGRDEVFQLQGYSTAEEAVAAYLLE